MALEDEKAWFEKNRAFIAQNYNGQWVVVKDKTIRGAYPNSAAAYTAGVSMFGTQPFLIKQALSEEKVHKVI